MDIQQILKNFIKGHYPQIICDKCMITFMTNVYRCNNENLILLEKRTLGLEYFCDAVEQYNLTKIPEIHKIGILDEEDNIITDAYDVKLFTHDEVEVRFIYVMERLKHLNKEDEDFFNQYVHHLDELDEASRQATLNCIRNRYGARLAEEIQKLFIYYQKHQDYIVWDLHGDNLMRRLTDNEIVNLDPFAFRI